MNPEIWRKPYNWSFENAELRTDLIKFFEALALAKRIQIDPFEDIVKIRCTYQNCKERYQANLNAFQKLAENPGYDSLRYLKIAHFHFYNEIGFGHGRITKHGYNIVNKTHKNNITKPVSYCFQCSKCCPFPWIWDNHECSRNAWFIDLAKPNTMTWKSSAWILMINYNHEVWQFLDNTIPGPKYDEKAVGWIIPDGPTADRVENICQVAFHNFRRLPKPKIFQTGSASPRGLVNSTKALGALNILAAIPTEYLPKVRKAIQSVLHPDRDPSNKEILTKAFQEFEAAWRKWEGK